MLGIKMQLIPQLLMNLKVGRHSGKSRRVENYDPRRKLRPLQNHGTTKIMTTTINESFRVGATPLGSGGGDPEHKIGKQ